MNVGIIGMGKMGILHTGILNRLDDVNITAIAEKENIIKNHIKLALPAANVYDNYEEMIRNENLDLIYITTPVKFHIPIALTCVKNNINFFMEKPLAQNIEECKELLIQLKNNSNIVHAVGYSKRFWDTFSKAKELLDLGLLGDLIYVKSSFYLSLLFSEGKGWRFTKKTSGGGALLDFGIHVLDLLIWYFGPIKEVGGIVKSYYSSEVEDFAHASMKFENGLVGYVDTSWSARGYRVPEISIEVQGKNGIMTVNDDLVKVTLDNDIHQYKKGTTIIYKQALFNGTLIDIGGVDFTREDLHVVKCVMDKKQTLINVFEASKSQSVIDAIYKSANEKITQEVSYL